MSATKPLESQRSWTADVVLEELECHRVAHGERVEGRAFMHIAAMEKDLAPARQTDESVALAD